jgi:methionyl-tRNA formyltransferase
LKKSPVHELAESLNIPTFYPEKANNAEFLEKLRAISPDLCITAAYGNYLPKAFLAIPKRGTINIHPSLLPLYRGAAPVQRCLEKGDSITGVSLLYSVQKMDAGPIVGKVTRKLYGHEKADSLLMELFTTGADELVRLLPKILDGTNEMMEQNDKDATAAPKLSIEDAKMDFSNMTAITIHNKVRGFADWPGTWSLFKVGDDGAPQRIKIITTVVLDENLINSIESNSVSETAEDNRVTMIAYPPLPHSESDKNISVLKVKCSDNSLLGIIELQPESRKIMKAVDFFNGLRGRNLFWCPLE